MFPDRPQCVGPYEIIATLAQGGMGVVYLARRNGIAGFRRFFAVKQLHASLANDPGAVAMFVDEARLAARIHHPNVVPVIELGDSEDGYFVVMDYIEGASASRLDTSARRARRLLPLPVTLRVVVDALAGLHAAHELRGDDGQDLALVHRDVSPQNIMVGTDGVSRLIDFGIARAAVIRAHHSTGAMVKGKPAYMPPEQLVGGALDRRTDVYAMGIVLCDLLTGRLLFGADVPDTDRLSGPLVRERVARRLGDADVRPQLRAVCLRALQQDPERRFPTAAAFAAAVRTAASFDGEQGIATHEQVAACLAEVLAPSLQRVREAIRALPRRPALRPPDLDLSARSEAGDETHAATVECSPPTATVPLPPPRPAILEPPPPPFRLGPSATLARAIGTLLLIVVAGSVLYGARLLTVGVGRAREPASTVTAIPSGSASAPEPRPPAEAPLPELSSVPAQTVIRAGSPRREPALPRMTGARPAPPRAPASPVATSGTASFGGRQ